jgi:hypothetical protein
MTQYDPYLMSFVGFCRDLAKRAAQSDVDYKVAAKLVNDGIFQQKYILTGLASPEANLLPPTKRTREHFFGRMATAKLLLDKLIKNPNRSDKAIYYFLLSRCRVHEVVKAQNNELRKYLMKNPGVHWRAAYQANNIALIGRTVGKRGRKPKCLTM